MYRRVEDVVQREVAGEVFLVPVRGHLADLQELYALNPVGRWLWERLDGAHSLAELVAGVTEVFEVEEPQARADADSFIEDLVGAGLVTEIGPEEEARP